ncbi:carbon monoxide dehydrogenase [Candidatus Acidianus copahuensis]|uniref:Carbon monoxide dehydrogenase n=1 Tax=Candidatus Acidianus copahuensis TaxID=1160895 RepID=A0A031LPW6_9CREN|nr:glyceraldehyde dehydrogenase subunit beta [Candidatus Acidianus copahuensis]EZQ07051.1 carbon monoxide dehydrogenase [Candidatus Acidianus copahuensis]
MYPTIFGLYEPSSIYDTLDFLDNGNAKIIAGGQSLIPMLKLRVIQPKFLVDLNKLRGDLDYIEDRGKSIGLGSLATHAKISTDQIVKSKIPLLSVTASKVGDMQVRNLGTLGGSVSNADPSADYPAVLLAYDATLTLISSGGERKVKASEFFKGPFSTELKDNEILREVEFPVLEGYAYKYEKIVRRAGDFAMVGIAVLAKVSDKVEDLRIAYTGVGEKAYRPYELEKELVGKKVTRDDLEKFAEKVSATLTPPSDSRGSSSYRKKVAKIATIKTLSEVLGVVS